jgi:hypothetical protein
MSHKSTKRSRVKTSRGTRERKARFPRRRGPFRWWIGIAGLLLGGVALGLFATRNGGSPSHPLDARRETAESSGSATWDSSWPALPAPVRRAARDMDEIRAAYAFAARRGELLQYIPC